MKKILAAILILLLVSCQPNKIVHRWTNKEIPPTHFKQILVLAVANDTDRVLASKMEDHFAQDLKEMGYYSIAANKIYPAGTFIKGDSARAITAINGKNFDAVFTMVLLEKGKERFYTPGRITDREQNMNSSRFERYINAVNERLYTPASYDEQTKYIWESNFYDLTNKQMLYSSRTRSFEYASSTVLAHTFAELLANDLVKRKIFSKPPPQLY